MALRLIEMVLQEKDGAEVRELLKEYKVLEHRAVKATRIAIGLWVALLAALIGMILLLRKG